MLDDVHACVESRDGNGRQVVQHTRNADGEKEAWEESTCSDCQHDE